MRIRSVLDLPAAMRDQVQEQLAPKPSKYGNVKTESDGIRFDSKLEAKRYGELMQMAACGMIADLQVHKSFALHATSPTGELVRIAAFEIDFTYRRGEQLVVEDTKSVATKRKEAYRLKKRHFEIEYALRVIEIERTPRKHSEHQGPNS